MERCVKNAHGTIMFRYRWKKDPVIRAFSVLMISASLLTGFARQTMAQANDVRELVTDRPDFTESGVVGPIGGLQFEGGFTWERATGDLRTTSGPEFLVRWGLTSRLELRFGLPDYVDLRGPLDESGTGDGSIGTKIQIGPLGDGRDVASVVTVSLPTGETGFTSGGLDPSVILTAGRAIGGTWSVGSQIFGELSKAGNEREFTWGGTLVFGTSLGRESGTGTFFELAATVPEAGGTEVSVHHGYTHLLSQTLQVDVHGGFGLTESAPDVFIGAGLVFRR